MCGGSLEIQENTGVAVCEYCGSEQTIPRGDDDVRTNLFNRANNLRLKCEFDKAQQVYEKILNADNTDAEAHWGVVLCKYGIEYVEDPKTHKRIPTCHRTQYESVLTDVDYLAAIENADATQRGVYTTQALDISRLQKDILAIVEKEKPFDVFLCYKETDENGKRTVDSSLANDIYYQLTNEGLKVFYAAITLEDKLGQEYEPYIFAALHSAKVMLVIGTKPEYFEAVWVRNEWSRFLSFMKTDRTKLLIPCYRDMDAYDLPEEFSHLQAQDMSKIGFVNDVVRGIRKVVSGTAVQPAPTAAQAPAPTASNVSGLLERAFLFLEDGKWQEADSYCEKVLDQNPKCAEAYLGKLMAELQIKKREKLKDAAEPFDTKDNCQKAGRFDAKIAKELADANAFIRERNENARKEKIYRRALEECNKNTEQSYKEASRLFSTITDYKDSSVRVKDCLKKAEIARREAIYVQAVTTSLRGGVASYVEAERLFLSISEYKDARTRAQECHYRADELRKEEIYNKALAALTGYHSIPELEFAQRDFETIPDYKDSRQKADDCRRMIWELKIMQEREAADCQRQQEEAAEAARIAAEKRKKLIVKIMKIGTPTVAVLIVLLLVLNYVIVPINQYNKAVALADAGEYEQAIAAFEAMGDYKDSDKKILDCKGFIKENQYQKAVALQESGEYEQAIAALEVLGDYKDSNQKILECKDQIKEEQYQNAVSLAESGEYERAMAVFESLGLYKDAEAKYTECMDLLLDAQFNAANQLAENGDYLQAAEVYEKLGYYKNATEKAKKMHFSMAAEAEKSENIELAISEYRKAVDYNNAQERVRELMVDYQKNCLGLVSAGFSHTVGVRKDGSVYAVGSNDSGKCNVSGWKNIIAVSAGTSYTVGLKSDGTVIATKYTDYYDHGQCNVSNWTNIVAVAAGSMHTIGLRSDGTVVSTKFIDINSTPYNGQCEVNGWTNIVAIANSGSTSYGLKADGTVVTTGSGKEKDETSQWTDIVILAEGGRAGIRSDGTVVVAGYSDEVKNEIKQWTDIISVSTDNHHIVGLRLDGTVVAAGNYDNYGECNVDTWKNIVAVSAGEEHTVGLRADGTVLAIGKDYYDKRCAVDGWKDMMLPVDRTNK